MKRPLRIGFLPFYVDYYEALSPDFGPRKREEIRRARAMLGAFGEVIGPEEPVSDSGAAAEVGRRLMSEGVDCAVALCVIAVFSEISDAAIRQLDVPLLLWHCQQISTVDAGYSMVEIVRNTGQIGMQALANVLGRRGRPFQALCASPDSSATRTGLPSFFAGVRAFRAIRGATVLQIGEPFPQMSDVIFPESHREVLGLRVVARSAAELTEAYRAVSHEAIGIETAFLRETWKVEDITDDELQRSVRLWLAVRGLAEAVRPDCATINSHGPNCLRNPEIGVTATYAISRLHASGISCSEVGDIPTALALVLLRELAGDALYTEVQVLDEVRGAVVLANSGEAADGLRCANAAPRLLGNTNFRGLHGRGASFAYPLAAGPATVVSLTPVGERDFHLIAMEGDILPEALPDPGAITGFFRPAHTGVHNACRQWVEAGPVHHAATCREHLSSALETLAALCRWRFTKI